MPRAHAKSRWSISAIAAAALTAALAALFRVPPASRSTAAENGARPRIELVPGRREELAMRDLAPLFLPTPFNAAPGELRQLEPGRGFFERDAERWRFPEIAPVLNLPEAVAVPATPVDALADTPGALASGMGQANTATAMLPASGGHVDVFAADARDSLLSVQLDPRIRPIASGPDVLGWKPLEFVAAVDPSGLVGGLVLTKGSGVEEVDNFFRNYLARTFRIGDRLPPGFYRIVVGP